MESSHLQTRTLTDALNEVDRILITHGTQLASALPRQRLDRAFAPNPTLGFERWACTASEFEEVLSSVRERAPELASKLRQPSDERDFTVIGHCCLDLRFQSDANGAKSVPHRLRDGSPVQGACVAAAAAQEFSSGLIALPVGRNFVYLFPPAGSPDAEAGLMASRIFRDRGTVKRTGLEITFPEARTQKVPSYEWVSQLRSEDGLFRVGNFVNSGEAILNHHGFFARETQVVEMMFLCIPEERFPLVIDGPFLAFFADDTGVHAAAWFDRDSFLRRY